MTRPTEAEVKDLRAGFVAGQPRHLGGIALCDDWLARDEWETNLAAMNSEMATRLDACQAVVEAARAVDYQLSGAGRRGGTNEAVLHNLSVALAVLAEKEGT